MPKLTEGNYIGDVVTFEEDDHFSREIVTIKADTGVYETGAVLGMQTADDKFVNATSGSTDGSETAVAILLEDVDTVGADVKAVVVKRHATVNRHGLKFGTTINDQTKRAAAINQLEAVTILVREGA